MNDIQNPSANENLKDTCALLQHQLSSVLILTCVVSLTLTIFFAMHFRALQKEVQALRTIAADYQTKTQPVLQDLSVKLVEFEKSHPDISPILKKYGVAVPTNAPAAPKK